MGDAQGRGVAGTKRLATILGLTLTLVVVISQIGWEDSPRVPVEFGAQKVSPGTEALPDSEGLKDPGREGPTSSTKTASSSSLEQESAARESLEPELDERSLVVRVRDARGELINGVGVALYRKRKKGWEVENREDLRISGKGDLRRKALFVEDWPSRYKGIAHWDGKSGRFDKFKLGKYWQDEEARELGGGPRLAVGIPMPGQSFASLPEQQRMELDYDYWPAKGVDLVIDDASLATLIPIKVQVHFADGRPAPGIPVGLFGTPLMREMGNGTFLQRTTSDAQGEAYISLSGILNMTAMFDESGMGPEVFDDLFEFSIAANIPSLSPIEVALSEGLDSGQVVRLDLPPLAHARATFWDHQSKPYGDEEHLVDFRIRWTEGTSLVSSKNLSTQSGTVRRSFSDLGWVGMGVACKGEAWPTGNTAPAGRVELQAIQASGELELRFEFGAPHLRLAWLVLDENQKPLINADLQFTERDLELDPNPKGKVRRHWARATTDGQGRFLRSMPEAPQKPRVIELRYTGAEQVTWASGPIPDQLPPRPKPKAKGDAPIVNVGQFNLSRTPLVDLPQPVEAVPISGAEGYVLDEDGTPIRGVQVWAYAIAKGRSRPLGRVKSSSDGHFDLELNFEERFRLTLSHESYVSWNPWPVQAFDPGTRGLQIVLTRGRAFSLTLQNYDLPFGEVIEIKASNDEQTFESRGSGSGEFEFKNLPAGRFDISLHAKNARIELARIEQVEPPENQADLDPRLVGLDLRTLAYARWYTFETPSGAPLKGKDVRMKVAGYPKARSRQDTNGTSRLFLILPRDVQFVTFHVEGIGSAVVLMGDDDVTVRLAAGG